MEQKSNIRRFEGIKLFNHQREVALIVKDLKGSGKTVTVKACRQVGKSVLASQILLFYAINFEKTKSALVEPTYNQSKRLHKEIVSAIKGSGIVKASNSSELTIEFINGSQISFHSAAQRDSLRGYTVSGILIVDEAAFISDDIYSLLLPWTTVHKAPTLLISTPFTRTGFFYENYARGLSGSENFISIDWSSEKYKEDILKILPTEKVEELRQVMPRNQFRSEILGEWLSDDGLVFQNFRNLTIPKQNISPSDKLYIGIDWCNGTGNDSTVISAINQSGHQVILDYFNDLNVTDTIKRISTLLKPYEKQIKCIVSEINSIGKGYTELIHKELRNIKIIEFTTSNSSKNDIITNLQVAFERGDIRIIDDAKQLNELGTFTSIYNQNTKTVKYEAIKGCHDDCCMALAFSWYAYLNNKGKNYSISIVSKKII